MKLKTLEEITKPFCSTEYGYPEGSTINEFDREGTATGEFIRKAMKDEAIKWIKDFEIAETKGKNIGKSNFYPDQFDDFCEDEVLDNGKELLTANFRLVKNWIKHFFNITKEDLK